ncbi:MAG TPA: hypothetical protein VGV09_20555 [Steroidobacteraceae bacterium]|nr:hypothetical protein [Steroidobacteraceae bacterium]
MTIGEFMDIRRNRLRVTLILAVVFIMAATTIIDRLTKPAPSVWWILPPGLVAAAALWWVGRKMVCPRCRRGLTYLIMAHRAPISRCPFCDADFSRPMP